MIGAVVAALCCMGAPIIVALVAGVVFVHGPPARVLIYAGAIALIVATLWNIVARRTQLAPATSA